MGPIKNVGAEFQKNATLVAIINQFSWILNTKSVGFINKAKFFKLVGDKVAFFHFKAQNIRKLTYCIALDPGVQIYTSKHLYPKTQNQNISKNIFFVKLNFFSRRNSCCPIWKWTTKLVTWPLVPKPALWLASDRKTLSYSVWKPKT